VSHVAVPAAEKGALHAYYLATNPPAAQAALQDFGRRCVQVCCSVLQCVAVHCCVLQCVAVCWKLVCVCVCVAVSCSVLQ